MACWDEAMRWRRWGFTGRWLLKIVGLVLDGGSKPGAKALNF